MHNLLADTSWWCCGRQIRWCERSADLELPDYTHDPEQFVAYLQAYMQQFTEHNVAQDAQGVTAEPSALAGILSERFLCGPVLTATQLQSPYYSNELGQVSQNHCS